MKPYGEKSMYIVVMTIPVPHVQKDAYRHWTEKSAKILQDYGCLRIEEVWGDWIPEGKLTDFNKAVQAKSGENIATQWQYWPSKEVLLEAEEQMKKDDAFSTDIEPPFEGNRLIAGGFTTFFSMSSEQ